MNSFNSRILKEVEEKQSHLCVGLDIYLENFDNGILPPFYYKLITEILYKLWIDAKKKNEKNTLDKIDIEYLTKEKCLLEWEEKTSKEKDLIYEKEQPRNANNKLIGIAGLIVSAIDITNSTSFSAGALIAIIANFL